MSASPPALITLCVLLQNRIGNLANSLNSIRPIDAQIIVIDAGGGGKIAQHLTSEYEGRYYRVPADPDESALLNMALAKVETPWALFMSQEEILHIESQEIFFGYINADRVLAFDIPVMYFDEPSNHHFQTRMIRSHSKVEWTHSVMPSLRESLIAARDAADLRQVSELLPGIAIVSLGLPEWEEWELRDRLVRFERELDKNQDDIRYWYYLAKETALLEEWDRSHAALEEGLGVVARFADAPIAEPEAVNGLLGMFCANMVRSNFSPKRTVDSLLTIFNNMPCDGRFSLPLGYLLVQAEKSRAAIQAQFSACSNFFQARNYHISEDEGLFKPAYFICEMAAKSSPEILLSNVLDLQRLLQQNDRNIQSVLRFVSEQNAALFKQIQEVLQDRLLPPGKAL